jgi:hypothetical protein
MAAYMALVKLGPEYAREVLQAADQLTPGLVQLLGDMGDPSLIPALESLTDSKDEEMAQVAHDSIEALREISNGN